MALSSGNGLGCPDDVGIWHDVAQFSFLSSSLMFAGLKLNWITKYIALVAVYQDIDCNFYTTVCYRNNNVFYVGNKYPDLEVAKFEYQIAKEISTGFGMIDKS